MADDRVKIYIDDAISQLKTSKKKYDYIISEPSNPWIAGIGNLYSTEFFKICKTRLNTNGVLTQWFHCYDVNNEIFRLVLNTISDVFPYVSIWKISDADVIILASADPLTIDFEAMESKMNQPRIATELARIKMYDVPALLSTQIVSARNNPYVLIKNDLNTAKKPLLEFMAPVALFTHESVTILDSLDERFSFQDKNLWFSEYVKQRPLKFENYMNIARYRSNSNTGDLPIAYSALRKALEMEPGNMEAQQMMAKTSADLQLPGVSFRQAQLEEFRMNYEQYQHDAAAIFAYLNALVEYYRIDNSIVNPQPMNDAVELMKNAAQNSPGEEERFRYVMAMILTGAGRYDEAAEVFTGLLKFQNPNGSGSPMLSKNELFFNITESYYNAGNLAEAERYFERLKSNAAENDTYKQMKRKIAMKKSGLR